MTGTVRLQPNPTIEQPNTTAERPDPGVRGVRLQPDRPAVIAILLAVFTLAPAVLPRVAAQLPGGAADDRFAGLQWRFVRMKYHHKFESGKVQQDFYGEPWGIDAPAAEQNLSRRIKTATAIQVEDAILLTIDDKRLFEYPWIYFVEPSSMRLQPNEIPILKEYFARGGFAMMDDFHGPAEW